MCLSHVFISFYKMSLLTVIQYRTNYFSSGGANHIPFDLSLCLFVCLCVCVCVHACVCVCHSWLLMIWRIKFGPLGFAPSRSHTHTYMNEKKGNREARFINHKKPTMIPRTAIYIYGELLLERAWKCICQLFLYLTDKDLFLHHTWWTMGAGLPVPLIISPDWGFFFHEVASRFLQSLVEFFWAHSRFSSKYCYFSAHHAHLSLNISKSRRSHTIRNCPCPFINVLTIAFLTIAPRG